MNRTTLWITLRTLWRQKSYAAITITGLSIAITGCILMTLYLRDELGFDRFHVDADRIYRLIDSQTTAESGTRHFASVMGPVGPTLARDFPEVEQSVRLLGRQVGGRLAVERGQNRFYVGDYYYADKNFFDLFSFRLLRGDPATALAAPRTVVLTESSARRYFGNEDPMGQTINVERWGPASVTGVIADPPSNSHLTFSMLFPIANLEGIEGWNNWMTAWRSDGFLTFVKLRPGGVPASVESGLGALFLRTMPADAPVRHALHLQPLADVHFGSSEIIGDDNQGKSTTAYLFIFSAIALFIAILACINYTNLATARALRRAREVGIRKVVGAVRGQVFVQFLSESIILAFLALAIACVLVALVLPSFNVLSGKELRLDLFSDPILTASLIAWAVVIGLFAGLYPAFVLAAFRPIQVLKGSFTSSVRGLLIRRGLVILQFVVSIVLLIATMVVRGQMSFIQERQLGFQPHQLAVVDINSGNSRKNFQAIKSEFLSVPGVRSVSVSSRVPGEWKNIMQVAARVPQSGRTIPAMSFIGIDENFLETFDVSLLQGRNFSPLHPGDSSAVLLNEEAVRVLGLDSPIGAVIDVPEAISNGSREALQFRVTVIGVVRDFHFRSLREPIQPIMLGHSMNPIQSIDYFTVRLEKIDPAATLARLKTIGERYDPTHPFEFNILDERLADFYVTEARAARIFSVASGLSMIIACLGLFGLATYTTERRIKEVGIRKVLGASSAGIFATLTRDFLVLVVAANALAWPIAYVLMNLWLEGFAYRTTFGVGTFAAAAVASIVIALVSVGSQALRGANANPVESLRFE